MPEAQTSPPPFLHQLAKVLLADHGADFRHVAVVLPNQRAGMFLRNELVKQAGKAIWSPYVLTMDKFVTEVTRWQIPYEIELLLELYKVYLSLPLPQHDPFYDFLGWGSIAMRHFSEVDANLIDRGHFYDDITSFEEIENWSLRNDPLSKNQQVMVARWHLHGELHRAFDAHLSKHKLGFTGLVERQAVEQLRAGNAHVPWQRIWFAGLHTLSVAEHKIIDLLHIAGKAKLAWEIDSHFMNDRVHAAGRTIRKHLAKWGPGVIEASDKLRSKPRQVEIGTVTGKVSALRYVVQHLKGLTPELIKRTTIVLTDAQLIAPLLEALPSSIGAVNVTMSVPLAKVPITGALTQCLLINAHVQESDKLPTHLFIDLLNNPVVRPLLDDDAFEQLISHWQRQGLTMISLAAARAQFKGRFGGIGEEISILLSSKSAQDLPVLLQRFVDLIKDEEGTLVNEQAYQLAKTVRSLKHVFEILPKAEWTTKNLLKMWQRFVSATSIGLYGEPLQGLQIMGLLETRALPLEHVIVLPANEGYLPPASFERSFIPFDVRRAFGLPLRADADATITYYFYRALASCSSMLLLVDASTTVEANHPTRFIDQLKLELNQRIDPSINTEIKETLIQAPTMQRDHQTYRVTKTPEVLSRIKLKIAKNLSPSAINAYLNCPLDFYYKYVLGLKDQTIPESDIQMNTIGNIVHDVVEQCYKPDYPLNIDHIMAKESIRNLLQHERKFLSNGGTVAVQSVEKFVEHESITHAGIPFKIGGVIDRIEIRENQLCIVDLKTGKVDFSSLNIRGFSLDNLQNKGKAIQLLAYAWIYLNCTNKVNEVSAKILSARNISSFPGIPLQVNRDPVISRSQIPEIDEFFDDLISLMVDPKEPLKHNPDSNYCAFCVAQKTEKETEVSFSS